MSFLIGYEIPKGRAVKRIEDRKEWLDTIKSLWKTVQYAIEDVSLSDDMTAEELLNEVDTFDEDFIITRDQLIESRMI